MESWKKHTLGPRILLYSGEEAGEMKTVSDLKALMVRISTARVPRLEFAAVRELVGRGASILVREEGATRRAVQDSREVRIERLEGMPPEVLKEVTAVALSVVQMAERVVERAVREGVTDDDEVTERLDVPPSLIVHYAASILLGFPSDLVRGQLESRSEDLMRTGYEIMFTNGQTRLVSGGEEVSEGVRALWLLLRLEEIEALVFGKMPERRVAVRDGGATFGQGRVMSSIPPFSREYAAVREMITAPEVSMTSAPTRYILSLDEREAGPAVYERLVRSAVAAAAVGGSSWAQFFALAAKVAQIADAAEERVGKGRERGVRAHQQAMALPLLSALLGIAETEDGGVAFSNPHWTGIFDSTPHALDMLPRLVRLVYGQDVLSRREVVEEARRMYAVMAGDRPGRNVTAFSLYGRVGTRTTTWAYDYTSALDYALDALTEMRSVKFGEVEPDSYDGPESAFRAVQLAAAVELFLTLLTGEMAGAPDVAKSIRVREAVISAAVAYAESGSSEEARAVLRRGVEEVAARVGYDSTAAEEVEDELLTAAEDIAAGGLYTPGMAAGDAFSAVVAMMARAHK